MLNRLCRRRLQQTLKTKPKTADQLSEMTKARRSLSKRIHELQSCQRVYIPGITSLLDVNQEDERLEDQPEDLKLWLPSQLSDDDRSTWCLPGISHLEFRFRYAQASDALVELRRQRELFQGTRDQNAKHTKSTTSTTRSQGILDGFHGKTKRIAIRYRGARRALLALDPKEKLAAGWKHYFLELKDADIRGPDREIYEKSEGNFRQSWIWTVPNPRPNPTHPTPSDSQPSAVDPAFPHQRPASSTPTVNEKIQQQSYRAHWARAQARAEQYEEEVGLTVEEMGRTLQYFKWKKSWWQSISSERAQSSNPPPLDVQDGLRAYAHRQSDIYDKLITLYVNDWRSFLLANALGSSWLCNYPVGAHPAPPARPRRGHRKSDAGLSVATDAPQRPTVPVGSVNSIPGSNTALQESTSQPEAPVQTSDDNTDAPLGSKSSDDDSDDDFPQDDDLWDDDSADED